MVVIPRVSPFPVAVRLGTVLGTLLLGGCPPPGRGCKAEAGYRRAAPVIAALDRYHQARGSYPQTLAELLPEWLPPPPPEDLQYTRSGENYKLTFSYSGPGVNHCEYDSGSPAPRSWQCHGYY